MAEGSPFARELLEALTALNNGNFSVRPQGEYTGIEREIVHTLSEHMDLMSGLTREVVRVVRETGAESKLGAQAEIGGALGEWRALVLNVNLMAAVLTGQLRDLGYVIDSLAAGDLSARMTAEANGEMAVIKERANSLAERLVDLKAAVERLVAAQKAVGEIEGKEE